MAVLCGKWIVCNTTTQKTGPLSRASTSVTPGGNLFINTEASQALSHTRHHSESVLIYNLKQTLIWPLSAFHKSHDFVSCSDPFTLKSRTFNTQRGKQFVCAITCSTFQAHEACKHYDNSSQSGKYCLTLSDASMNRPIHLHTRRERDRSRRDKEKPISC